MAFVNPRRAYGLDEIALTPGLLTIDPEDVNTHSQIAGLDLEIPVFLSAMDSVVDPKMAVLAYELGAGAVLNLQGVWTRYADAPEILKQITSVSRTEYVELMQKIYSEKVKTDLLQSRIQEIKKSKAKAVGAVTPQVAEEYYPLLLEAGLDVLVIQSTVVSTQHSSKKHKPLDLKAFCSKSKIPVIVGNCVSTAVGLQFMEAGVSAVLVGIGPGAACTSRGVLGIGVPMATAIADVSLAREQYQKKSGRYVPVIADGGMVVSGDICKALACGADAVMIGSPFAKADEAPGLGFHWGMATPNSTLPRGTRLNVGRNGPLKTILRGPATVDDGSQNFLGAIALSMSTLGAANLAEMRQVEVMIAPSILTEGKVYQKAQQLGMYK